MASEHKQHLPLTADDIARIEHRASRFRGAVGTVYQDISRDVFRLLAERERLLRELVSKQTEPGSQ